MQYLKYFIFIAITLLVMSCDKYDLQGFFMSPSKERVNERFEQSIAYNSEHQEDTLITTNSDEYQFATAADFHIKTTANNLSKYIKSTAPVSCKNNCANTFPIAIVSKMFKSLLCWAKNPFS